MATAKVALVVSESSVSTSANTSKVTATLYYYGNGVSYSSISSNNKVTITIDGTSTTSYTTFTTSTSAQKIGSASKTITHDDDGSATITVKGSLATNVSIGTLSTSKSVTLTTIDRVSPVSLSASSAYLGNTITVSTNRYSSSFTHTLYYKVGSGSKTSFATSVGSSYTWTIPTSFASSYMTSSTSATVTVYCYTYDSDGDSIGYSTATFTAKVPTDSAYYPTATIDSLTEGNETVSGSSLSGVWLQGYSTVVGAVSGEGVYGSSISSYSTTLAGSTYSGSSWTSNTLTSSGDYTATLTVTDSRSRTGTATQTITVVPYAAPVINSVTYERQDSTGASDAEGEYLAITITYTAYSVSNLNNLSISLAYMAASETSKTTYGTLLSIAKGEWSTDEDYSSYVTATLTGVSADETYNLYVTISDAINSVTETVNTGQICISRLAGGKGVALFKEASRPGLDIYGNNAYLTSADSDSATKFRAKNSSTGAEVGLMVGASGYNRGVYDLTDGSNQWMFYKDDDDDLHVGTSTVGAANQIMYLNSGVPTAGYLIQTGKVSVTGAGSSGGTTNSSVTFDIEYSSTPVVLVTAISAGLANIKECSAGGISTTGFTAYLYATSSSSYNIQWVAIGKSSAATIDTTEDTIDNVDNTTTVSAGD